MSLVEGDTREAVYKTIHNMISHLGIFTNKQVWVNYLKEYIQVGLQKAERGFSLLTKYTLVII